MASFRRAGSVVETLGRASSAPAPAAAKLLYVASSSGGLTTLDLSPLHARPAAAADDSDAAPAELRSVASFHVGGAPSCLAVDRPRNRLYCVGEDLLALRGGALAALTTSPDGALKQLTSHPTAPKPAAAALCMNGRFMSIVHHDEQALSLWYVSNRTKMKLAWKLRQTLGPGQEMPTPSQIALDPGGAFAAVPGLKQDRLHLFRITNAKPSMKRVGVARTEPRSGPRHVAFAVTRGETYMYLVTETTKRIIGFKVHYQKGLMSLEELFSMGIRGTSRSPKRICPLEIAVTPDNQSVMVSWRNRDAEETAAASWRYKDGAGTAPGIPAGALMHFAIDPANGHLVDAEEVAFGHGGPRHFSVSASGTLVAVGLHQGRVAVMLRRARTPALKPALTPALTPVGTAIVAGEVTSLAFDG